MARSVLVVDDDGDMREMMAQLLAIEEIDARMAANGREALDQLASGFRPDVILLDLMMPLMDGRQFLERCHRDPLCAAIPVVVLSAASDRLVPRMADAVLQKPVEFARLLDTLRRYAGRSGR